MADDDTGAIDTEDYSPATDEQQPPAAAAQPAAPAQPQAEVGLPNMGPPPFAQEAAQESVGQGLAKTGALIGQGMRQDVENFKNSGPANVAKRIVSYLMGSDAENPAALDQVGQQVDPRGQLSPSDRNLLAIDHAHAQGGEEAAWKLLQANRVAYNAKQSFAKAALTGTGQKPPDLNAAIDAANQAQAHVLDGSNIQFAAAQGRVTATVTMPGTSQPQQIALTPEQFAQWLDVGGAGQYDKVMEGSAPATLQKIASSAAVGRPAPKKQQTPGAQPQAQPDAEGGQPQAPAYNPQPQRTKAQITGQAQVSEPGAEPAIPGTHDENGHYLGPQTADETNYGPELEARSRKIFGEYPSSATEPARQQWMAAQEEKELERGNRIDVASEKGKKAKEVAEIQGGWRYKGQQAIGDSRVKASENYSQAKIQAATLAMQRQLAHEEAVNGRSERSNAMRGAVSLASTGQLKEMTPAQRKFFDDTIAGVRVPQGETPQAPTPQAPKPAAGQKQTAAPQAGSSKPATVTQNGHTYTLQPDGSYK